MGGWKKLLTAIGIIGLAGEILEYLALPALFVAIGLLSGFGWQYYAWTIGGYGVLVILAELVGALIGTMMGKAFELRLLRKLNRAARLKAPTENN